MDKTGSLSRLRQSWFLCLGMFGGFTATAHQVYGQATILRFSVQGEGRRESREIIDPCLGLHWQLVVDPAHPAGPGRLIPMGDPTLRTTASATPGGSEPGPTLAPLFVIRAGERVTVEQDTPVLHAQFRAVALESAAVGEKLRVRLSTGSNGGSNAGTNVPMSTLGPVLTVTAAARGRVRW